MRLLSVSVSVAFALLACGDNGAPSPRPDATAPDGGTGGDAGDLDSGTGDGGGSFERFLTRLESAADLASLTAPGSGEVKYLAYVEGRDRIGTLTEDCYFQNMRLFPWHVQFLQSFEEFRGLGYQAYLDLVLRAASRVFWGGAVKAWPNVLHPRTNAFGIVSFVVYAEQGSLRRENIVAVRDILLECAPFTQDLLVFVPDGIPQKQLVQAEQGWLRDQGVDFLFPEQLIDGLGHQAYSVGEGYGTLRVVPRGQSLEDYGPRDIVVVESAPNDISIVQGLITKDPQNEFSHVNLRLREKDIPNVAVPRIYEAAFVQSLENLLVHLVVSADSFTVEAARLEDAEAFWAAHRPMVPQPQADLTVGELEGFETLRHADAISFGVKAANLGELHSVLPAEHREEGFGIPFRHYVEFMAQNGLAGAADELAQDARMATDLAYKRARLSTLRNQIRSGVIDPGFFAALDARLRQVFGGSVTTTRIRFRSSTNVEDLDVLTGAGLYDSRSGCLGDDLDADAAGPSVCLSVEERTYLEARLVSLRAELSAHPERTYLLGIIEEVEQDLSDEKPVARAVRRVWASLWNERAFDERAYYGIDHRRAYMGMAVHPTAVMEQANAVAVTNLIVDAGDPMYRVNSQVGDESVVQPEDPTAVAEVLTFRRSGNPPVVANVEIRVRSSRLGPDGRVWSEGELATLGGLLFTAHDHFATNVYSHLSPFSLDVEIEKMRDGRIVLKQARPYVSNQP